jgi:hypothetical protein
MDLIFIRFFATIRYRQLTNRKGNKMTVSTATYKVGDTYTSQKSKVTGTIQEIKPLANGNVRVKLDVAGTTRYTTWTAQ